MSTTSNTLQERLAETRAAASAEMAIRILIELINEPNGKRFAKNRATRIERWQQLTTLADAQLSGLRGIAKAPAVKRRSKPTARDAIAALDPGIAGVAITAAVMES